MWPAGSPRHFQLQWEKVTTRAQHPPMVSRAQAVPMRAGAGVTDREVEPLG